ncbi:hypothetical protein BOX15_Mlig002911g1 [Macrostomum lignano]|uniref:Copper type II ascorbate-dependent monooxygenase C-terminal domain-containing protein n=1 Tax=Macrostomum lignano TaxID=282301 RepID=A0A267FXI1_9PLAT|nr:hypothetical protein BOX15_Mlig002911g1 [Macrostomum lignano]
MKTVLKVLVAALVPLQFAMAHIEFESRIPNGDRVPNPCRDGAVWSDDKNPFGFDFKAAGQQWTADLCRKDSDGDGLTNGQELGDPDCVWTVGAAPARMTGLSHPGICPLDSATCKNSWTKCPKAFSCPAMEEPGVTVRNFTVKPTAVPTYEKMHLCQAFELNNTASPVHMIGSRPIMVNKNVIRHMVMYGCSQKPDQALFDSPQQCYMGSYPNCIELINLWGEGNEGECFSRFSGFRVGGEGFQYGMLSLKPAKTNGFINEAGLSIYFTSNLRPHDQGTLTYGELELILPPRRTVVNYNHTCPSVCTRSFHSETRYITAASIYMQSYATKGRLSLWRNGALVQDLVPLHAYEYNVPRVLLFDPPVEYRRGDEIKTECYYSTKGNNHSVLFGYGSNDETCLSFMHYYPNNIHLSPLAKLEFCNSIHGYNPCWNDTGITPHIENGCNITGLITGDGLKPVYMAMWRHQCFVSMGCSAACQEYMSNTLFPSNACFDPKRSLKALEYLYIRYHSPLSHQAKGYMNSMYPILKSCQNQIETLALLDQARLASKPAVNPPAVKSIPPADCNTGKPHEEVLTSKNLLVIIVVCSCLVFALLAAVLLLVVRIRKLRLRDSPTKLRNEQDEAGKEKVYNAYG